MKLWTRGEAEYSRCKRYRYTLTRTMNPDLVGDDARTIAFIGLNPSTATATMILRDYVSPPGNPPGDPQYPPFM